jgi:hypothetical protein
MSYRGESQAEGGEPDIAVAINAVNKINQPSGISKLAIYALRSYNLYGQKLLLVGVGLLRAVFYIFRKEKG